MFLVMMKRRRRPRTLVSIIVAEHDAATVVAELVFSLEWGRAGEAWC